MSAGGTAVQDAVIRMGNDIARQFAHRPREQAVEEISAHILKFWDPSMRAELSRCISLDAHDIEPILADAARNWPNEEDTQADRHEPSGG